MQQQLEEGLRVVRADVDPPGIIPVGVKGAVVEVRPECFRVAWELDQPWARQVYTRDYWGTVVIPVEEK